MKIDQLPTFTINRLAHDRAFGTFDQPLWIGERHFGCLVLPDERVAHGRFVDVRLSSRTAAFVPTAPEDIGAMLPGITYRRLDGYWGERAALVLDRQRRWSQRVFESVDAWAFHRPGGTLVGNVMGPDLPEGAKIIRGGWDHEHCEICWEKISPHTDPVAMFSEPDHWICRGCHEDYVVPQSLDFILRGGF